MISIKTLFGPTLSIFVVLCIVATTPAAQVAQVEHGQYLVQHVGLCGDCHSPHDNHGQIIGARALQGAALTFKPLSSVPNWVDYAPALVGLPGFSDEQMVTFLTTGKDPAGQFARPPMPAYRFSKKDAIAVVDYLRSLAPKKKP